MPRWTIKRTHATSSTRWAPQCAHHRTHSGPPVSATWVHITSYGARGDDRTSKQTISPPTVANQCSSQSRRRPPTLSILNGQKRTGAPRHDIASNQTVPCPRTVMMSSSRSAFWPPTVDHPGCTTSKIVPTERETVGTASTNAIIVTSDGRQTGRWGRSSLIICPMDGSPSG